MTTENLTNTMLYTFFVNFKAKQGFHSDKDIFKGKRLLKELNKIQKNKSYTGRHGNYV